MDKDEKIAFRLHSFKFKDVLKELSRRFRIPWQDIVKIDMGMDERMNEWFDGCVLPCVKCRVAERLYAERAGKILFNLFDEDENEKDGLVIEAKQKLRGIVSKVQ
jgi:hypothetical protein